MNQKQADDFLAKVDKIIEDDQAREKRARAFYIGKKTGDWTKYDELSK